jgi:hypothetical protein
MRSPVGPAGTGGEVEERPSSLLRRETSDSRLELPQQILRRKRPERNGLSTMSGRLDHGFNIRAMSTCRPR